MKKRALIILTGISIVMAACGPRPQPETELEEPPADKTETIMDDPEIGVLVSDTHQAFFDNLASLCNQSFEGEQIYRSHHAPGWEDYEMVMHVEVCEPDHIHIPFHVGEDQSRTWMFLIEDGRLRFRHDHRYPDGTPEEETLYGGYADDSGTAFVQHFPADQYTAELIEGGEGNVWTVRMDEALTTFTYRLERDGEKRLRIDFDLTNPL